VIRKSQTDLLTHLEAIKTTFESTWILVSNQEEVHLWDWVEMTTDEQEWINIVFEDFPHNNSAHMAYKACEEALAFLESICEQTSRRAKMKSWLFD
jgi:hypothetical protein